MSKQSISFDTYLKCNEMIDDQYRDELLIRKIHHFSASTESNFRIIAVRLTPLFQLPRKLFQYILHYLSTEFL